MNLEWPHVVHICVSMWECVCKREIEIPRTSPGSLGKSKRKMGNINLMKGNHWVTKPSNKKYCVFKLVVTMSLLQSTNYTRNEFRWAKQIFHA